MTRTITRSPGLGTGLGFIVGGGYSGAREELDATVREAAEMLREAYGMDVVIRFNSDRMSGGAWLKTDEPDGIWLNAEVGICAWMTTEARLERAREIGLTPSAEPERIYVSAHVGKRVGEYAHVGVETLADALAYVQTHADLSKLEE